MFSGNLHSSDLIFKAIVCGRYKPLLKLKEIMTYRDLETYKKLLVICSMNRYFMHINI